MTFPAVILDTRVHLFHGGKWNAVTSDVRGMTAPGGRVRIARGSTDEAGQSRPTQCGLTVNNRDGKYSPRNPTSPLFGLIGRNTPLRVSVGEPNVGAADSSTTAATSHVAPSVTAATAGLLLCAWAGGLAAESYTIPVGMTAGPAQTHGRDTMASASQAVSAGATGTRTATVTTATTWGAGSVLLHGASPVVQQTLSGVANTAGANTVTLTTAAGTQAGWWLVAVQHWTYVSEVRTRFMPDAPQDGEGGWVLLADSGIVETGSVDRDQLRMWARRVRRAGAQQVTFFGIPTVNAANHAHLYVLSGVDFWSPRATVEVSAWPPRWDVSGRDVWVPVDGAGVLRRLGQGRAPLYSPIRRATTGALIAGIDFGTTHRRTGLPVAYWPVEDGTQATTTASGLTGGAPMQLSGGTLEFGQTAGPGGSDTLPDMLGSTGRLTGPVPATVPDSTDTWSVTFVVNFSGTNVWPVLEINGGEAFALVRLEFTASISLIGVDDAGTATTIGTLSGADHNLSDGAWYLVELHAFISGGDTVYQLAVHNEDGTVRVAAYVQFGNPVAGGGNPGPIASVTLRSRDAGTTASAGHVAVYAGEYDEQSLLVVPSVGGHAGETAGRRVERLCGEEQIPFHPVGVLADTTPMGPQRVDSLLDLLRECETADLGVLYEPREALGLAYRTRGSLYNQTAGLALTYGAAGEVAPSLEPTDDDQATRNDVTVERVDATGTGGSTRAVQKTGPLSVQDPPDGVGPGYDASIPVNVASDRALPDQAGWRLHLGTVDEPRFPTVRVNLAALGNAGKTTLLRAAAGLDIGDKLTIGSPPVWLPPDLIAQLAQGLSETLGQYEWDIGVNASPESPWTVGLYAADAGTPGPVEPKRYSSESSQTDAAFVAGTDTALTVATLVGQLWTTAAADLPLDIHAAGARLRVTAIAGQAASFRSVASAASGTTGSFTVSKPTGTVAGDVLVAFHTCDAGTLAAMTLSGGATWLPLAGELNEDGTGGVKAWWKEAGGAEPASYTFGQNASADGVAAVAAVAAGRPVTPHADVVLPTGSSTTMPTPSTGPVAGCVELRWVSAELNVTYTPPAGFTERADLASQTFVSGSLATRHVTAGGQTGVHDFTASASAPDRRGVTVNVVGTQTFTITQAAVNGVAKTVPAATPVRLWQQAVLGL